ncbi:RNA-directed DNA polymerase, eukaryota [Tanacetum coccineum]
MSKISTSIFITNFPDHFYAKDLWKTCNQYGNVVDTFIPNRRSKSGKRFGFVHFIKVLDVVHLVNNLCTIWVDRYKLHANIARFQRPPQKNNNAHYPKNGGAKFATNVNIKEGQNLANSYIQAIKKGTNSGSKEEINTPVFVLDDTCLNHNEFPACLMGKVKEFNSLTNLKVVLANEGFETIKIKYMGEYWVMLVFQSEELKNKFRENVSMRSWFSILQQASSLFQNEERVTWLDIEGVPLKYWTKATFNKIASKWGELLYDDDADETYFHSKRICIKTKLVENILESFKIVFKGNVFWVRAKEASGWIPDFVEDEEDEIDSDSGIGKDDIEADNDENLNYEDIGKNNEVEEVSETIFEKEQDQAHNMNERSTGDADSCNNFQEGGSVLQVMEELAKIGQIMGYNMEGLAQKAKKDWVKELCNINKVNVLSLQETKMENIELFTIESCWGNLNFDYVYSPSVGEWIPTGKQTLIISIYAPQELSEKKMLWDYFINVIGNWKRDVVIMGDFNEVRTQEERYGSVFNIQAAKAFNLFISVAGLEEVCLGGCSFTWCHKTAKKMSKLDRFLISESLMISCPNIHAITLDRHLLDHRPILMREAQFDYGPIPFKFYHRWFEMEGFDSFVEKTWNEALITDSNDISKFSKKLKHLKDKIRVWVKYKKESSNHYTKSLKVELAEIDNLIDKGEGDSEFLNRRIYVTKFLQDIEKLASLEMAQKSKIKWAIEGDENSKFFHGILNKKRSQLAIRGILSDGAWIDSPNLVKKEFLSHFTKRFAKVETPSLQINSDFPKKLDLDQQVILEREISRDEVKRAVWDCGTDKSPGPDGFTFGFYRRYWSFLDKDVEKVVRYFFHHGVFSKAGNSSFIALLPKVPNANKVNDFRPITLIGSLYKIISKILANRLVDVVGDIVNEVQSAFVANKQILDDMWRGEELFKSKYPRIYALESNKDVTVAEKVSHDSLGFSLRRAPRSGIEQTQLNNLSVYIEGMTLVDMRDKWSWSLDGSGEFSVASVRNLIDDYRLNTVSSKTRWSKAVPIKINIHAWKVKMDGLPTRFNISRRGMKIDSILCQSCGTVVESTSHIFFKCNLAKEIFHKITSWWDVDYVELSSYQDWFDWMSNLRLSSKHKSVIEGISYTMWWTIWNFRNTSIFGSKLQHKASLFDDIVFRSFYWCKFRYTLIYDYDLTVGIHRLIFLYGDIGRRNTAKGDEISGHLKLDKSPLKA